MIDFSTCTTSKDTYNKVAEIVKSKSLDEVKAHIAKKFFNVDDVVEFLYIVLTSQGNGILHGPGGFGKSQITKEFLSFYGIPVSVKVGHSAMDVEALLGIPNIKKLTEESEYEIVFEKSIFNIPSVIILEEFLDVRPTVASALKDIITEGGYRQDDRFIASRSGPMIICSNKSPEEVSIDLSTAAFYKERFPYSSYVCWDKFTKEYYHKLFGTVFDDVDTYKQQYELLSTICAYSSVNDNIVSPRVAIKARDAYITTNKVTSLRYIPSLDFSKIEEVQKELEEIRFYEGLSIHIKDLITAINKIDKSEYTADLYFTLLNLTKKLKMKFSSDKIIGDALLSLGSKLLENIDSKIQEMFDYLMLNQSDSHQLFKGPYNKIDEYFT